MSRIFLECLGSFLERLEEMDSKGTTPSQIPYTKLLMTENIISVANYVTWKLMTENIISVANYVTWKLRPSDSSTPVILCPITGVDGCGPAKCKQIKRRSSKTTDAKNH